jgi:hypothetical protein
MAISNPGPGHTGVDGSLNSVPASKKATLSSNYIDFTSGSGNDWGQQFLPDLMEKEAEVFGNRTISGFLSQVGAEESMASDQVVWSEQGRLHLSYIGTVNCTNNEVTIAGGGAGVTTDIDGNTIASGEHGVRINDMVIVATAEGSIKCNVTNVSATVATCHPYEHNDIQDTDAFGTGTADVCTLLVIGSEFGKGVGDQGGVLGTSTSATAGYGNVRPTHTSFSNKPIIIKDYYEISGSDTSQIGWVEISGEEGQSGYLWYLKAEGDTRARFTDYLEMTMLEAVKGTATDTDTDADAGQGGLTAGNTIGTEGLFAAIETRGNITTGITGVNAATDLAEFDAILAEFDNQGAIEENMMFVNRASSLAMDDMLASMNSYGAGGTSYGVFDNEEDMALNLGFSGFRRGSYDFYKSDFRYLNDKATRGSINSRDAVAPLRGVIVPAGTSTVYDQSLGKNLKRPFLHVRYRASQTESRKMKTWTTGSVGATTSALDAMQVHYLSERCLITQGANNFMLMK